jgi:hypothetical protein
VTTKISESFGTSQVAVTTAASKVVNGANGRDTVTLYNTGSADCYLGANSGVTASTGFKLVAGAAITMETTADIYAIGTAATTLNILVEG